MAGFILFERDSSKQEWSSANWVFRELIDHAITIAASDEEVAQVLKVGKYHQCLEMDVLAQTDRQLYHHTVRALRQACDEIMRGVKLATNAGRILDRESQTQFRRVVSELLPVLPKI